MSAILPPGVSAMLVEYAIDQERYASLLRRGNCTAQASVCASKATAARDAVSAHEVALQARADNLDAHRRAFADGYGARVDLRHLLGERVA